MTSSLLPTPSFTSSSSLSRRRNRPLPLSGLSSPSTSTKNAFFSSVYHSSNPQSPVDNSAKSRNPYFCESQDPTVALNTSDVPISDIGLLMPSAVDFPTTHNVDCQFLGDSSDVAHMWTNLNHLSSRGVANVLTAVPRTNSHHRDQSNSSIGSQSISSYNNRAQTMASGKSQRQQGPPTPTLTPVKNSFPSHPPSNNTPQQHQSQDLARTSATSMALSQALLQPHHMMDDNLSHLSRSNRPSFSTIGQEPMTPMTAISDYHDDSRRSNQAGESHSSSVDAWLAEYLRSGNHADMMTTPMVPKFERTLTDAYQDELYFQPQMQASQPSTSASYLMPHHNQPHNHNHMVQERLNDARMARTASSSTNQSGPLSPFKANSPYVHSPGSYGRQARPIGADGRASPLTASEPKTISPQEALLDYKPQGDETPLFSQSGANYGTYTSVAPPTPKTTSYQTAPTMAYASMNNVSNLPWSTDMQAATLSAAPIQNYNFVAPSIASSLQGMPNPYLASGPVPNRSISRQTDRTPEFPAHLTSMESSASEAAPPSSGKSSILLDTSKPTSNADSGTYSCTYHGCSQRFSTPRELQKHKRDVHRSNPNVTPGIGSGMSTQQLMERNSQTGPHRCERINPTTGKPCNTNFSRPYDLTRHEDTIHNIRKLKLKCALCTEEKLFSRNDALTRHMRVVHPEVDFPGKHRRRGRRGD